MSIKYITTVTTEILISSELSYLISPILMFIMFIMIAIILYLNNKNDKSKNKPYEPRIGDSDKEIQKYLPDMTEEKLINILYNKFLEIETAYINYDYDTLKKDCTSELYDSYNSDLENIKTNKPQNKFKNIEYIKSNINGIVKENEYIIVKMYLQISINYELEDNSQNKKFFLTFIIKNNKTICPSCGAEIESGLSECKYCHTIINNNYMDFVLSSKKELD